MSRHEGVNCDACQKGNFKGKRYKCLICFDYDLCSACYESGVTNSTHTIDHPMQCILTAADYELYYGGEAISNPEHPHSYSCPFCTRVGFTVVTLEEHVVGEHSDVGTAEVICPVCAAHPGGEPNFTTTDFIGHLTLEHNPEFRDLISFLDEPASGTAATARPNLHRITPTTTTTSTTRRGFGSSRTRRSNMHFSVFNSAGGVSTVSTARDAVDPIAELLTQLSGVRRSTTNATVGGHSQLQMEHLQLQMQLERDHYNAARLQMEHRFSRRKAPAPGHGSTSNQENNNFSVLNTSPLLSIASASTSSGVAQKVSNAFLLDTALKEAQALQEEDGKVLASRNDFLKHILLSTLQKKSVEPAEKAAEKEKRDVVADKSPRVLKKSRVLPVSVVPLPSNQVRGRARASFLKQRKGLFESPKQLNSK